MTQDNVQSENSEVGQKTDAGGKGKEEEPMEEAEKASLSECVKTNKVQANVKRLGKQRIGKGEGDQESPLIYKKRFRK